jgi:molybdopterin synthase sulfur carrier subunit
MAGRYGTEFAAVLARSRVWINGDEAAEGPSTELHEGDEVAVLPPVSGGSGGVVRHNGTIPDRW